MHAKVHVKLKVHSKSSFTSGDPAISKLAEQVCDSLD